MYCKLFISSLNFVKSCRTLYLNEPYEMVEFFGLENSLSIIKFVMVTVIVGNISQNNIFAPQ